MAVEVIPVPLRREVEEGDDLARMLAGAAGGLRDGDVLVVSHKAVSKQEGRVVELASVFPTLLSEGIAAEYGRDPRLVEVILSETERIVRMEGGVIICRTRGGLVCANAGVDESNAGEGRAVMLPLDPDASAERLRKAILERTGRSVAVLVSDTFGRPFRNGQTDVAVGAAGIGAVRDYAGSRDAHGRELRVTAIAVADELCAAAELVKGKAAGVPAAVVRNYAFPAGGGPAASLVRPEPEDLFR